MPTNVKSKEKFNKKKLKEKLEFYSIIYDLIHNDTVKEMKNYRQHYDISTFKHCLNVSYLNYKICKKLKLDYISSARARYDS